MPPLTFDEQIKLAAALMEIKHERTNSLKRMFENTTLKFKDKKGPAQDVAKSAKDVKKKIAKIPGVDLPDLQVNIPRLNVKLFKGLKLRKLIDIDIPSLSLPGFNLPMIPDIKLGNLPDFNLPTIRLNLKGILSYKDLLPDINLRALIWAMGLKWPHLDMPSIIFDLSKILDIDLPSIIPNFPNLSMPDLSFDLPNLALPDINMPGFVPPNFDLDLSMTVNLPSINIPGFDVPSLLKIPGFDKVLNLLFELFDVSDISIIIEELGLDLISDFITSALPIIQQVKSGGKAVSEWSKSAQDLHKSFKVNKQKQFMLPGDTQGACHAIQTMLRGRSGEHAALAGIHTTQLATSTAGLFADLGGVTGPVVAAAASLAKLCQKIYILSARYKERKKVNHILKTSPGEALSANIFEVCPLLGCYYIVNNTTSNVLNVLSSNIIEDKWMDNAELNKKSYLDPLIKTSQSFIKSSIYVLDPIRQDKGMYQERGRFGRWKAGVSLSMKKRFGKAPKTAKVSTHEYIGRR